MATAPARLSLTRARNTQLSPRTVAGAEFASFKGKWALLGHLAVSGFATIEQSSSCCIGSRKMNFTENTAHHAPKQCAARHVGRQPAQPKITELSLGGGLSDKGHRHVHCYPWKTLVHLQLVECNTTSIMQGILTLSATPQRAFP